MTNETSPAMYPVLIDHKSDGALGPGVTWRAWQPTAASHCGQRPAPRHLVIRLGARVELEVVVLVLPEDVAGPCATSLGDLTVRYPELVAIWWLGVTETGDLALRYPELVAI